MAAKEILRYGDPLLFQRSKEIENFDSKELHQLVDDMLETMLANDGAGLAAPQIGVLKRVVIFGSKKSIENPRYPEAGHVPYTVLINPEINIIGDQKLGMWEGCLSVPGMRGYIERPSHIRYSGYDLKGQRIDREVQGFHAVVVQHECDHLDGILYPMKITDMRMFGFHEEVVEQLHSSE